jgi:lysophospholipase L1-like esterase
LFFILEIFLCLNGSAQTYKFDFGIASEPAVAGYTKVTTAHLYTRKYSGDTVNGFFGFENWDSLHLQGLSRVNPSGLNRDVIVGWNNNGFSSFYFSVRVPEGNYRVTFYIGDFGAPAQTTVKAESRRLLIENLETQTGQIVTRTFTIMRRDSSISGSKSKVALDDSYGREYPPICLGWDHKLTFEFCGERPCIGGVEIVRADSAVTLHLCGNSTIVEQEDEPWTAWGQMVPRFFHSNISVNDLGSSGLTAAVFLNGNRLKKICSVMKPGDYLFFEFGHNDSKTEGYEPGFRAAMKAFRDSAAAHGATMIFITPVARRGDADSATSVGGSADLTRSTARSLEAKLIDLNAMSLRLKAALGSSSVKEYAHFTANHLWPDQDAINDDTHFSDFGAYEVARCVLQNGLKASGTALYNDLVDTTTFNPSKPDNPASWSIPSSLDTVFRHATPGAAVRADSTFAAAARTPGSPILKRPCLHLAVHSLMSKVRYPAGFEGDGVFTIRCVQGKRIFEKRHALEKSGGWFQWKAIHALPPGVYFFSMKIGNKVVDELKFCPW